MSVEEARERVLDGVQDVKRGALAGDVVYPALDALIAAVREEEREACAQMADMRDDEIAARIRARGKGDV